MVQGIVQNAAGVTYGYLLVVDQQFKGEELATLLFVAQLFGVKRDHAINASDVDLLVCGLVECLEVDGAERKPASDVNVIKVVVCAVEPGIAAIGDDQQGRVAQRTGPIDAVAQQAVLLFVVVDKLVAFGQVAVYAGFGCTQPELPQSVAADQVDAVAAEAVWVLVAMLIEGHLLLGKVVAVGPTFRSSYPELALAVPL